MSRTLTSSAALWGKRCEGRQYIVIRIPQVACDKIPTQPSSSQKKTKVTELQMHEHRSQGPVFCPFLACVLFRVGLIVWLAEKRVEKTAALSFCDPDSPDVRQEQVS